MKIAKVLLMIVAIALLLASGCQLAYDMWPMGKSVALEDYNQASTKGGLTVIATEKTEIEKAVIKHIKEQIGLKSEMELDKARYARAIEQANFNIEKAETDRQAMIGTIDNPGWLLGLVLGGTGFGAYFAGYRKQRPEDWTEKEHQEEILKVKNDNT